MTSQLRRTAISVPSNIAEGRTRDPTRECLHFISVAMGSLAERETQFLLSEKLNYLEIGALNKLLEQTGKIGRTLRGLQQALKAKLDSHPPSP
ncbi:MAG: four helix bundle protein [Pseudomonadota bacterium]